MIVEPHVWGIMLFASGALMALDGVALAVVAVWGVRGADGK